MLWQAPDFDEHIFDPRKNYIYNGHEINKKIDHLEWFTSEYPIIRSMISLLRTTANLLNMTSTEPFLAKLRQQSNQERDWQQILEKMAKEINLAKEKLQQQPIDSREYRLLNAAIQYCLACLRHRKEELRITKDEIYANYWVSSSLMNL